MNRSASVFPVLVALLAAAPAGAQDAWSGAWTLEGQHEALGAFTGALEVEADLEVTETLLLASGQEVVRRGQGRAVAGALEVDLVDVPGLAGALEGATREGRRLSLRRDGDDLLVEGRDARGASRARGRARLAERGRHLLVVARRHVDRAVHRGLRLREEVEAGRFLHLGVGVAVRPLRPEALSEAMRAATGPRQVWLVTEVSGGARAPFGTTIPLGDVAVSVGLEPGARLRYEVTDRYDLPAGVTDAETLARGLSLAARRSFDLPLSADDALALTPGARRALTGEASVALSGALSIGHEVADVDGILRIGASARAGGVWRLQGDLRLEVERLGGAAARVRVTRGQRAAREASAEALLGAVLDAGALAARVAPGAEYLDHAVVRGAAESVARDLVRFQVRGAAGRVDHDELELCWRFDLERAPARAAYERAVRGDLSAADAAARAPGAGVWFEHRVLDVEARTYQRADLALSVVLRAGARRAMTWTDLEVDRGAGVSRYEVLRFTRERSLELFGRRRRRSMELDLVRRAGPDGAVTRALRWTLEALDRTTTAGDVRELRRALAGWGLDPASSLPEPERRPLRSRYGVTRTRLTVEVSEAGVAAALAASDAALFRAYVDAWTTIEGELPLWATREGRERIRDAAHASDSRDRLDQERHALWRAERFVEGVRALAEAPELRERARRLEALAKGARYDLYAVTALLALVPREATRVAGTIEGERIGVAASATGAGFAPLVVDDPR
ncbi:MAG: hypothetical protein M9894_20185 [Planctomycetes bacterium]|nr:hypothetical protein [Planctomycetota bacterium]